MLEPPRLAEFDLCARTRLVLVVLGVTLWISALVLLGGPGRPLDRLRGAMLVAITPLWICWTHLSRRFHAVRRRSAGAI